MSGDKMELVIPKVLSVTYSIQTCEVMDWIFSVIKFSILVNVTYFQSPVRCIYDTVKECTLLKGGGGAHL